MKSPFPGMDPYMERRWSGVHKSLIVYAATEINRHLVEAGDDLIAEIEERLVVATPDAEPRDIYPDVYARELPAAERALKPVAGGGAAVAMAEPLIVPAEPSPPPQLYVRITEVGGGRAVTVIEFLSPTNKFAGPDRDQYLQKRRDVIAAGVNFVEIDLTRAGPRTPPLEVARAPGVAEATYLAFARRGFGGGVFEVYPISLREPLPTIRVPLRPSDADVPLALQSLIDRVYAEGLHGRTTRYAEPLRPRLPAEDAEWAARLLAEAESQRR